MSNKKYLELTLVKSVIGRLPKHRATIEALGLKRISHTVKREDTPSLRGMINKVNYMIKVEECD